MDGQGYGFGQIGQGAGGGMGGGGMDYGWLTALIQHFMSTPQGQGMLQQGLSGVPSAGQMNQQFFQQNGENAQLSNAIPLGAMPHWMSNGQWNDQQGVQKAGAFSPNPLLMGGGGSQAPSQPNPFGGALGGYAFGGVDTTNTPFKTLGGMPSGKQTFGPWSGAGMLQLGQGFPSSFNSFR